MTESQAPVRNLHGAPLGVISAVLLFAGSLAGCAAAPSQRVAPARPQVPLVTKAEAAPTEAAPCDGLDLELGRLHVSQRWNLAKHKCIVMVSGEGHAGKARSYLFNSEGMLMTFNVLGKGPVSKATGARTHLLLPNVQKLRVESKGTRILVHTTSGHVVTFNGITGEPEGMSGGEFRVEKTPSAQHGGGVELSTNTGVVVDFGFARGGSPHENPNGLATISDGRGQACTVKNSQVLSYLNAEPKVAISTQSELSAFLSSPAGASCGALTVAAR